MTGARARASLRLEVVIELGTCRSGRGGGAPSAPTFGNGRDLDDPALGSPEGESPPFGDQESMCGDAQGFTQPDGWTFGLGGLASVFR